MSQTIESVLARLEEPDTPVVWLDPSTQGEIWDRLPALLTERGYRVIRLPDDPPLRSLDALLTELWRLIPLPAEAAPSLENLALSGLALPPDACRGLLIVFRTPDTFRQQDEAGFEAFVEALESAAEGHARLRDGVLKLVLAG
jgi:hypothetical protein